MRIYVTKRFTFEASHVLPLHPGECRNLHGHSYKLFVTVRSTDGTEEPDVQGEIPDKGYFIDFGQLSEAVEYLIIDVHDHQHLNDQPCMKGKQATAENLALHFWEELEACFANGWGHIMLHEIKLYETEDSFVTIRR